jgi:hypothetical protein
MMRVSDDVLIAHVARVAIGPDGDPLPPTDDRNQPFSETTWSDSLVLNEICDAHTGDRTKQSDIQTLH